MVWDYYMDWGLFRSKEPGRYMLRKDLGYPAKFYYFAMVTNLLLRFFWVLSIIHWPYKDDPDSFMAHFEFVTVWGMFAEAIRRA